MGANFLAITMQEKQRYKIELWSLNTNHTISPSVPSWQSYEQVNTTFAPYQRYKLPVNVSVFGPLLPVYSNLSIVWYSFHISFVCGHFSTNSTEGRKLVSCTILRRCPHYRPASFQHLCTQRLLNALNSFRCLKAGCTTCIEHWQRKTTDCCWTKFVKWPTSK